MDFLCPGELSAQSFWHNCENLQEAEHKLKGGMGLDKTGRIFCNSRLKTLQNNLTRKQVVMKLPPLAASVSSDLFFISYDLEQKDHFGL